jgi:hypothetical protein
MNEITELVGGVLLDSTDRALLLHRRDYMQWEVPAGRIEPEELVLAGLARIMHDTVGIDITGAHPITKEPVRFEQRGKSYSCRLFQITSFEGEPWVVEPHLYDKESPQSLLNRQVMQQRNSPVVQKLIEMIDRGDTGITWSNNVE